MARGAAAREGGLGRGRRGARGAGVLAALPLVQAGARGDVVIALPADGANLDASKQLAAWWMGTEAQTEWSGLLGDTPFNPNASVENPVLDGLVSTVGDNEYEVLQRFWEATPPPDFPNYAAGTAGPAAARMSRHRTSDRVRAGLPARRQSDRRVSAPGPPSGLHRGGGGDRAPSALRP